MAEVALCLSGGGYRAAMFHLGVLTYLNEIRAQDGTPFLDNVHIITCISGGALPGIKYVLGEKNSANRTETFKTLYKDLVGNKLGEMLIERFNQKSSEGVSLIKVLAEIYDEVFFHGRTFKEILEFVSWERFHHFSADATDFELGMPFRFQATPKINDPNRACEYGVVGNKLHKISRQDAMDIKLADIMAATSCFPLAFEPIVYPEDFSDLQCVDNFGTSFLLMDGGLVDNHGIDPVIHAKEHLQYNNREIDIYILSDAVNTTSEIENTWKDDFWDSSPKKICFGVIIVALLFLGGAFSLGKICPFISGILGTIGFCCGILLLIIKMVVGSAFRAIENKIGFSMNKRDFFWKSSIRNISRFVLTRIGTVYKMVDIIMMGNLKKNSIRNLANEEVANEKLILNTLPLFGMSDKWKKILKKDFMNDKALKPSKEIVINSKKANSMRTSLWFTQDEIKNNIPKAILACGQYTICWNLLQCARKLKSEYGQTEDEMSDGQKILCELEPILYGDWKRFKANPLCKTANYES